MKRPIKRFYYDLETTGLNSNMHSIHQLGIIIEIDQKIVKEICYDIKPHPKGLVEEQALAVSGKTLKQVMGYEDQEKVFKKLMKLLKQYIDPFDKNDKFNLIGFNNNYFDNTFFTKFFDLNKESFFWSYFHGGSIDAMCLAAQYLIERREGIPSFKLHIVAYELGIVVDKTKTHDALYDVYLTREIYRIVTGLELEL